MHLQFFAAHGLVMFKSGARRNRLELTL